MVLQDGFVTWKTSLILKIVGKYDKAIRKQVKLSIKTHVKFYSKAT